MSELEKTSEDDPLNQLGKYVSYEQERLGLANEFLSEALPTVQDIAGCNQLFQEANRPDLIITQPATMMPISHPLDIHSQASNFTPNFQVTTGHHEWEEDRTDKGLPPKKHRERIPVTYEELDGVRVGAPKFEDLSISHVHKAAYQRMLVLFPDFTRTLTLDFSWQGYASLHERYAAELFVAYQLMSRLVDQNDPNVMRDGTVDARYLCR